MVILIVDDSPTQRALWMYALGAAPIKGDTPEEIAQALHADTAGLRIVTARDGQQALQLLKAIRFDLLITDIDMPGLDGWKLAARAHALDTKLPVMVVSSMVKTGERADVEGVDHARLHLVAKADRDHAVSVARNVLSGMAI